MQEGQVKPISYIHLGMIVKNEGKIIGRCFESVRDYISNYTIIDTGSTDNTIEEIENALEGIPGQILQREWVNFAHNRNEVLYESQGWLMSYDSSTPLAQHYLLLLDADHTIEVDGDVLSHLDADGYHIRIAGDFSWWMPYLVRADKRWKYVGVTHEFLTCDDPHVLPNLTGMVIWHHGDGGTRPEKYERDIALLQAEFEQHPDDARTVFYLANTYRDVGRTDQALDLYRHRATLGGWDEEVYDTLYNVAKITNNLEDWFKATVYRPARLEAPAGLVRRLNELGAYGFSYEISSQLPEVPTHEDLLFVDHSAENYLIPFERAIAAWWVGKREEAKATFEALLERTDVPQNYRDSCVSNLAHC